MAILRHPLLWILFFSLPFLMVGVGSLALNDNDAMYPQIAKEMRLSGDWITPRLDGAPHFDKPPLVYWLIGATQEVFGDSEATARIWPVMAVWFTILVVGGIGASLYGKRAGWLSALVFSGSLGPYLYSRVVSVSTDTLLALWTALAVLSYIRAVVDDGRHRTLWLLLMFASFGLAGMTKALLGIGLPVTVIGLHAILTGRWKSFLSWPAAAGCALMFAIMAPWHILVARVNPEFLWFYFVREHLLRFTGERFPRDEFLSAPVFLAFVVMWTFPWLGLLPQAFSGSFRRIREAGREKARDLLPCLWILVVVGLFTASRSRLEYYSLPAIPAFALLIGKLWDEAIEGGRRSTRRFMAIALGLMSIMFLLAAVAAWEVLGPSKEAVFRFLETCWPDSGWSGLAAQMSVLQRMHIPTVVVLAGSAVVVMWAAAASLASRPRLALGLLVGIMAPIFLMANWGFMLMEPFMSSRPIVSILQKAGPVQAIVIPEPHEYQWVSGMVYYSGRKVYILKDPNLHDPSLNRGPGTMFLNQGEFLKLWGSKERVVFVCSRSEESKISKLLQPDPVDVIGGFGTRVVVTNGLTQVSGKGEDHPEGRRLDLLNNGRSRNSL